MRKFISKIFTYPTSLRQEIDKMIDNKVSNSVILKFLENYKDKIGGKVPDPYTFYRYVMYRSNGVNVSTSNVVKDEKTINEEEKQKEQKNLVQVREQIQLSELIDNKKELLNTLVVKCNDRLNRIEQRSPGTVDLRWEYIFKSYITEVREIVTALAKLSGELKEDNVVIVNVVQNEMTKFLVVVHQILKETCPEKLDIIKEKLKIKFKESILGNNK
jgi:hypothetical protein